MENISKSFFNKPVNKDISLNVEKGEIHAILGENGAGKTTLMNILYGIYSRDSGIIRWKDDEVIFNAPREAIQRHIGMLHQHFMLVPTLSVSQNITLGLKSPGHPIPNRRRLNNEINELSFKYGLDIEPEAKISDLSVGEQQRVEIIKILYRNAELLILDEPTAVLTPQETERFFEVLLKLKMEGHSVIIITHRIPEVMAITDKITVLRDGCKIADVNTADTNINDLSRLMIGRDLTPTRINRTYDNSHEIQPRLIIEDLEYSSKNLTKLRNITFSLNPGEILGIAGVDGNGQKELIECIIGIRKANKGSILLNRKNIVALSIAERKNLGMAYISDDRHRDGLILDMDLTENFLLKAPGVNSIVKRGFINYRKYRALTEQAIKLYDVKSPDMKMPIRLLSGGNQQKIILARELAGNPSVVIAFQPTRGLDIAAAEFIRNQLLDLRENGCSIILISTDLEEILNLSNRIGIIFEGRIVEIMKNDEEVDTIKIGLLMAGHEDSENESE